MSNNRIKAKVKRPSRGPMTVELTTERRDAWNRVTERRTFTVNLSVLERALRDATIEAPWKELLRR